MKIKFFKQRFTSVRIRLLELQVAKVEIFYEGDDLNMLDGDNEPADYITGDDKYAAVPSDLKNELSALLKVCLQGDSGKFDWDVKNDILDLTYQFVDSCHSSFSTANIESAIAAVNQVQTLTPKEGWALAKLGCDFSKPIPNSMIVEAKRQAKLNALIEFWEKDLQSEAENSPVGETLSDEQLAKVVVKMEKFALKNDNGKVINYGDISNIIEIVAAKKC